MQKWGLSVKAMCISERIEIKQDRFIESWKSLSRIQLFVIS